MRQTGVVHPQMLGRVQPNFYPSLCTVQSNTPAVDSWGQPIPDYSTLAGHANLPCRIAPRSTQERSTPAQVYVTASHHVALGGYYPAIRETMQAVIDGLAYGIEGVEWDGNRKTTRLYVSKVT